MKLLFIDACMGSSELSRTKRLAEAFLTECEAMGVYVEREVLSPAAYPAFDRELVNKRNELIDAGELSHPMFEAAKRLMDADLVLVAAPYWDLSFPAVLKLYVENVEVRGLSFACADADGFIGLGKSKALMYITTAGGYIGTHDYGFEYVCAISAMLGLGDCSKIAVDGLDLEGNDPANLMASALEDMSHLALNWLQGNITRKKV